MKITLKNAKVAAAALTGMAAKAFPAKMGYALGVNQEILEKEAKRLEEERVKICERYAEKDSEGKPVTNGNAYLLTDKEACEKEYQELLDDEVELDIRTVPMELAERCETVDKYDTLTVGEFRILGFMFTE